MAKPFGKLPTEWLRLPSTIEYREALLNAVKSLNFEDQVVTQRGIPESGGGTWMHEDELTDTGKYGNGGNLIVTEKGGIEGSGATPGDWLQNQQLQAIIEAIPKVRKSTSADLVIVKK